jgi:acetyl-CoA C-acetyltransferase
MIMTRKKAESFALKPLATILATATSPRNRICSRSNPAYAINKLLAKAGLTLDEIDLFEINEAFAAVPLVSSKILAGGDQKVMEGILERMNVNGGAIAIGHPVGASGARIIMTLMYELGRTGEASAWPEFCGGFVPGGRHRHPGGLSRHRNFCHVVVIFSE